MKQSILRLNVSRSVNVIKEYILLLNICYSFFLYIILFNLFFVNQLARISARNFVLLLPDPRVLFLYLTPIVSSFYFFFFLFSFLVSLLLLPLRFFVFVFVLFLTFQVLPLKSLSIPFGRWSWTFLFLQKIFLFSFFSKFSRRVEEKVKEEKEEES